MKNREQNINFIDKVAYLPPCIVWTMVGALLIIINGISAVHIRSVIITSWPQISSYLIGIFYLYCSLVIVGVLIVIIGLTRCLSITDTDWMLYQVEYRLFGRSSGNPLGIANGIDKPLLKVDSFSNGLYRVTIGTQCCDPDKLQGLVKIISSAFHGKFEGFAVVRVDEDPAGRFVSYIVDNVLEDRRITAFSVEDLIFYGSPGTPYSIRIQKDFYIDLRKAGSILIAGKTRSGKTTAVITILLQILFYGRDPFGSKVYIIDPKDAELAFLPHTFGPDKDGTAHSILNVIRDFDVQRRFRQEALNHMSGDSGNQVKWYEVGMAPCILFIDEYVALQSFFPRKASKDDPDYSLQEFQDLIRKIVTMGASAGCFVILSTAEASVESAGIPSMIRSAMGTKILMRPTVPEGTLMWDKEKLVNMPERLYGPGDAWISSTDGLHDSPSFVQFPTLNFGEYGALSRLLAKYYGSDEAPATGDA